ncbi:MAG: endonuclease/exonuclease/phosphatase family protein [Bacteroidales bacterium]|nr:endonuclease/exonuclease/phosphatase family protein [Bacteroidales bacterium]
MKFNRKKRKKLKIFLRLFFNVLFIVYLFIVFLSTTAHIIPPSLSVIPSFLALLFPLIAASYIIFFFLIIYFKKYKHLPVALPLFILVMYDINNYIPYLKLFENNSNKTRPIRVLSYNVRLFDRYNWKNNYKYRQPILDYIVKENPDIVCLQEYYFQSDGKYPTTEYLQKKLKAKNINQYFSIHLRGTDYFGIATYSIFPIIKKETIKFKNTSNIVLITDILINADTVRIYNVHLESFRLSEEDIIFLKKPTNLTTNYGKANTIIHYLTRAFLKREIQTDSLFNSIKNCKYPIILCGDFNDIPASYTYKKINKFLKNAYDIIDLNLGSTYNGYIPFLRIDNIFYSSHFSSKNFSIDRTNKFSDHFPIKCDLYYHKNNK